MGLGSVWEAGFTSGWGGVSTGSTLSTRTCSASPAHAHYTALSPVKHCMVYCSDVFGKLSRAHTTYLVDKSCPSQLCASLHPRARSIVGQENLPSETSLTTEQVYNSFDYGQWHQKYFLSMLSTWQAMPELTELSSAEESSGPLWHSASLTTLSAFSGLRGQVSGQGFLLLDPGSDL